MRNYHLRKKKTIFISLLVFFSNFILKINKFVDFFPKKKKNYNNLINIT